MRSAPYYETQSGAAYAGDSRKLLKELPASSIDLICTSPPFALLREKEYGNPSAEDYIDWFKPFLKQFRRVLTDEGSFIIDLGGSWQKGKPYRSLYQYKFLIEICEEKEDGNEKTSGEKEEEEQSEELPWRGWHLAQELYWYNPAKLPTPAEWVTIRRIRVKDSLNSVWWLRPTDYVDEKGGKVSNRKVLKPYSDAQKNLMENGYNKGRRPSDHSPSDVWGKENDGAIPPNLLEDRDFELEAGDSVFATAPDEDPREPVSVISASNTASNTPYHQLCTAHDIERHPARFPRDLPEFAIKLTTDEEDVVLDPFAGSNMTGQEAQRANRQWIAFDEEERYLKGSVFRFPELYCDREKDAPSAEQESEESRPVTEQEHSGTPDLFSDE
jgi:site-specific DNA-methyltransferase (cytosine-N4-specific)